MTKISGDKILGNLPPSLRDELLLAYNQILRNYREGRWEPSELNAGKFCEVVYSVLRGHVDGSFPMNASKPSNMVDSCRLLEASTSFPRSVRIQIPRMLVALYEIRNNRGVGHVGGDVNPNHMDATCVLYMCKWILADLVRIFHNIDTIAAQNVVENIVDKILPIVWVVDDKLRVLDTSLKMKDKTLVLLYHKAGSVQESDLAAWVEHTNPTVYRRDILRVAHRDKLIEYDPGTKKVQLSPKGIEYVEKKILKT